MPSTLVPFGFYFLSHQPSTPPGGDSSLQNLIFIFGHPWYFWTKDKWIILGRWGIRYRSGGYATHYAGGKTQERCPRFYKSVESSTSFSNPRQSYAVDASVEWELFMVGKGRILIDIKGLWLELPRGLSMVCWPRPRCEPPLDVTPGRANRGARA